MIEFRSQIEFGILSIDDVAQLSHVKVFNNEIYDAQQKPIENGLVDPRMVILAVNV